MEPLRLRVKRLWLVASTFVGTVVGAGFASGRELLYFFVSYGRAAYWGVCLAAALLAIFGYYSVSLGQHARNRRVRAAVSLTHGTFIATALDITLMLLLFGGMCVMLAGGGALAMQQLGLTHTSGILLLAAAVVGTTLFGLEGIKWANALIVPALLMVTGILWWQAGKLPPLPLSLGGGPTPWWWGTATLYAGFNSMMALPVLVSLGATERKSTGMVGVIVGAAGVGTLCGVMIAMLLRLPPSGVMADVPMLELARLLGPSWPALFFLVLWAEMYTTAIANLYGVAQSVVGYLNISYSVAVLVLALVATVVARAGFARLVETLYPLFGMISLLMYALVMLTHWLPTRRTRRS